MNLRDGQSWEQLLILTQRFLMCAFASGWPSRALKTWFTWHVAFAETEPASRERGRREAFWDVNSNKVIITLRFCLSALSPQGHCTTWVCWDWTGFLWHDSHSILILAAGNLSSRKWKKPVGDILLSWACEGNEAARGQLSRGHCGPCVIFSNTSRPDIWWWPATSLVSLPWRWPALSLGYVSPGFFLGRSWQWCHHLVMLLGDLVRRAGSTLFSSTLKLNCEKHSWEPKMRRVAKGEPPGPSHLISKPLSWLAFIWPSFQQSSAWKSHKGKTMWEEIDEISFSM